MATSGGGGGQAPTVDDFSMIVCLVIGSAIGLWIAWMVYHAEMSMAYTYLRRAELGWLDLIGSLGIPGASSVSSWFEKGCAASGLFERCERDFSTMKWKEITKLSFYVNVMLLPIVLWSAFRIFANIQLKHPNLLFAKVFSVDTFVRAKKPLYRHLRMFDSLDLIGAPLDHPVLGMSQTSRQYVFHHRLLVDTGEKGDGWIKESDGSYTPVLDRAKTEAVFKQSLGEIWRGWDKLTPSETMLLAIAIPRVAATNGALTDAEFKACLKESAEMIDWCWDQFKPPQAQSKNKKNAADVESDPLQWLRPTVDLKVPLKTIGRYIESAPMLAILTKHAYVRTVLFAAFTSARSLGVLPPAEMRWLRFFDRDLWYVLQNFGRQGAFAEGGAVHVHYLYEIKSGSALVEPQLDKAITALEEALTAFKYKPADRDSYISGARVIHEGVTTESVEPESPVKTNEEPSKDGSIKI